jgi:hypothetical protein
VVTAIEVKPPTTGPKVCPKLPVLKVQLKVSSQSIPLDSDITGPSSIDTSA